MVDTLLLVKKAQAISRALASIKPKEIDLPPSGTFGEDYNSLRQLVLEQSPNLEKVMPPPLTIDQLAQGGQQVTRARYVEILSFVEQIISLLDGDA